MKNSSSTTSNDRTNGSKVSNRNSDSIVSDTTVTVSDGRKSFSEAMGTSVKCSPPSSRRSIASNDKSNDSVFDGSNVLQKRASLNIDTSDTQRPLKRSSSTGSLLIDKQSPSKIFGCDHGGVLYKRRDVFRNQWRARYFVLSRESGMLRYYLVPIARFESMSLHTDDVIDTLNIGNPRGTFYLPGCTVFVNDKLSRSGKYYAFTILVQGSDPEDTSNPNNVTPIHLATRTHEERMQWVQRLSPVCRSHASNISAIDIDASVNSLNISNHSAEEDMEEDSEEDEDQGETPQEDTELSSEESVSLQSVDLLHENVPLHITTLIDEKIRRILHFFRESTNRGNRWKRLRFRRKNVNAFQKRRPGSPPLIRIESFMNHHPCFLLQYLIDTTKRTEYDTNLRLTNRLKVFNTNTFLDYYAYKPSHKVSITARDFCVVTHWRVLPNKSILYVSFSYSDQKLCPLDLDHVRADFLCNAFLFQPSAMNQANSCFVKRIFSTDLNGKLPTSVVNAFTLQQIKLLSSLDAYLEQIDAPQPFTPEISNETVAEIIQPLLQQQENNDILKCHEIVTIDPLESSHRVSMQTKKETKTTKYISFPFWLIVAFGLLLILPTICVTLYKWILIPIYQHILFIFFLPLTGLLILQNCNDIAYHKHAQYARTNQRHNFVVHFPFFIDGCVLFFPVVAYHLSTTSAPQFREIVFVISLFVSLRSFVLSKIGPRFKYADNSPVLMMSGHKGLGTGVVTCRFDIELKGILRYISAKKTLADKDAEIAVTHIVIKAAARAISEFPAFNGYKLSIPMLAIQGYFPYRQIDISVAKGIHRSSSESNYTSKLCNVDQLTIKDIAMQVAMKRSNDNTDQSLLSKIFTKFVRDDSKDFGSCVVLTSPNSENADIEIDVAPSLSVSNTPTVVIVVGGVRILSQPMNKSSSKGHSSNTARPFLHMSISMNCPAASVATCRKFAERLQKLAQVPEICDEVLE